MPTLLNYTPLGGLFQMDDGRQMDLPMEVATDIFGAEGVQGNPGVEPPPPPPDPALQQALPPALSLAPQLLQAPQPQPGITLPGQAPGAPMLPEAPMAPEQAPVAPGVGMAPQGATGQGMLPEQPQAAPVAPLEVPHVLGADGNIDPEFAPFVQAAEVQAAGAAQVANAQIAQQEAERQGMVDANAQAVLDNDATQKIYDDAIKAADDSNTLTMQALNSISAVNPNQHWDNASNLNKGMWIFAAAINGGLAVTTGQKNTVLEMMDEVVRTDIAAQEANIATQKQRVTKLQQMGEQSREDWTVKAARQKEQALFRYQTLINAAKAKAMEMESEITRGKYMTDIVAPLMTKNAEIWVGLKKDRADLALKVAKQREDERNGRASRAAAYANAAESKARAAAVRSEAAIKAKEAAKKGPGGDIDPKRIVNNPRDINDEWVVSREVSDGEMSKLRDPKHGMAPHSMFLEDARGLYLLQKEIGAEYGGKGKGLKYIGSEKFQKARRLYQSMVTKIRHDTYGAALTPTEAGNFNEWFPPPETWTSLKSHDDYKEIIQRKGKEFNQTFVAPYGLRKKDGTPVDVSDWTKLPEEGKTDAPQAFNMIKGTAEAAKAGMNVSGATIDENLAQLQHMAKMGEAGDVQAGLDLRYAVHEAVRLADTLEQQGDGLGAAKLRYGISAIKDTVNNLDIRGKTSGTKAPAPPSTLPDVSFPNRPSRR